MFGNDERLRLVISGQGYFGAVALEVLLSAGFTVSLVVSPENSGSAGPGGKPDRLLTAAQRHGIAWRSCDGDIAEAIPNGTDLLVAAHSHAFVGRLARSKCKHGAIGYHPSLLPLHRGRDAVRWTIKMMDRIAGGTVYWLDEIVDGGPVAAQDWCFVRPGDTADELWRRDLCPMGLRLLRLVVEEIERGAAKMVPQDPKLATWEPAITGVPALHRKDLPKLGDLNGCPVNGDARALGMAAVRAAAYGIDLYKEVERAEGRA